MRSSDRAVRSARELPGPGARISTGRLLCEYTLVFAVFFAVVFSPFWVYGRSFFWRADGMTQYFPELTFSRSWARSILTSLREGHLRIPLWSLFIGFGQGTLGNIVSYKPLNFLYCLFPFDALELYAILRLAVGLYLSGLSFIAYARTRSRNRLYMILGSMIYLFTGFIPCYVTRHWLFLEMTLALPLMLLGVDQVFDRKWSWLFVLVVFVTALSYFYTLYMVTLPAVIYAAFHYFELEQEERRARGGLGRIFLRHVVQFLAGIGLAAVNMLPSIFTAFESCRTAAQKGLDLLHWNLNGYFTFVRGIVDAKSIVDNGFIALPSVSLAAILCLFCLHRKRDRLVLGQIILYNLAFLIPALTLVFSAFAGKTLRWCYAFTFWAALCTACMLPRMRAHGGECLRFSAWGLIAYTLLYVGVCIWTGNDITIGFVMLCPGFFALYAAFVSDWGRKHQAAATALLFLIVLAELTAKSYVRFSPQFDNGIAMYANAGSVIQRSTDNAAGILEKVSDEGVYRVDIPISEESERIYLSNYGARDSVNGVSSYYNLNSERLVSWSLGLGNPHSKFMFMINDLDQRTALDALMGVKYVAVLEADLNRVPYGFEKVRSRAKTLSTGETTTEYLFRNRYALPLAYAYENRVSSQDYQALSPNRKEQALLQGVVLDSEAPLPEANLVFDDVVLMDSESLLDALKKAAAEDENLEVREGMLRVKKANYSVSLPIEPTEGELSLQFRSLRFHAVNFKAEQLESLSEENATRLKVINARRAARQWTAPDSSTITASSGSLSDNCLLLDDEHQYFFGEKDILLNLGYGKSGKKLKLKFSEPGEYTFDSVALICQPMDNYAEKLAPLQANGAKSTTIDGNRVVVEFDLEQDAMACLAIPYSGGWHAKVDGAPAQIVPANVTFMGVMLPRGAHTVEFTYMPKGLRLGAAISIATLVALIAGTIVAHTRRRGKRKGNSRMT